MSNKHYLNFLHKNQLVVVLAFPFELRRYTISTWQRTKKAPHRWEALISFGVIGGSRTLDLLLRRIPSKASTPLIPQSFLVFFIKCYCFVFLRIIRLLKVFKSVIAPILHPYCPITNTSPIFRLVLFNMYNINHPRVIRFVSRYPPNLQNRF